MNTSLLCPSIPFYCPLDPTYLLYCTQKGYTHRRKIMAYNTKKQRKAPVTRKTLISRAVLILLVFLFAGSVSYPKGANWVIDRFNEITTSDISHMDYPIVFGLDLQGGTHLEYVADLSAVPEEERASAMDGVRDVIERRVNQLGVSEPLVQTTRAGNQWRLTVELAGIRDINEAIRMIGETPILEFRTENPDAGRELTDEEKAGIEAENQARLEVLGYALDRAKGGEDLSALASEYHAEHSYIEESVYSGWLSEAPELSVANDSIQDIEAGALVPEVVDVDSKALIIKTEESRPAGTQVQASHLLISWAGAQNSVSTSTKEEALAKIQDIASQVTYENFAEFVRGYSEEPGSAQTAGDLGWFGQGFAVEEFEAPVFAQEVGTISDIVETPFGYHLIKKTGQRDTKDYRVMAIVTDLETEEEIVNPEPYIRTALTGKQLERAVLDFDPNTGAPQVALQFDDEGTKLFADMTRENINKPIAIYLDEAPISIPVVQVEIPNGQAVINGSFTIEEAKLLAQRLQAGALPVPIEIIAQQSVGPVLGAESVQHSLQAGLIGFLLVIIFMVLYYRLPGLIAVAALAFYTALVFALFKLIPVTLSLSGIAGFILSIGMAVDANVLIFERLKEELKAGKDSMSVSVDHAFARAWSSIRDGNVTTLIVCFVLYTFTSSLIKGFALTLSIGILVSMFSAIVVTKSLLKLLVHTPLSKKLPWLFLKSGK